MTSPDAIAEYEQMLSRTDGLIDRMMNGPDFASRHLAAREAVALMDSTNRFQGLSERLQAAGHHAEARSLYDYGNPEALTSRLNNAVGRSVQTNPHEDLRLLADGIDPTAAAGIVDGRRTSMRPRGGRPSPFRDKQKTKCKSCDEEEKKKKAEEEARRKRTGEELAKDLPPGSKVVSTGKDHVVYETPSGEQRIRFNADAAGTYGDAKPGRNYTSDADAGVTADGRPFVYEGRHRAVGAAHGDVIPPELGGVPNRPGVLDYEYVPNVPNTARYGERNIRDLTIDYTMPEGRRPP